MTDSLSKVVWRRVVPSGVRVCVFSHFFSSLLVVGSHSEGPPWPYRSVPSVLVYLYPVYAFLSDTRLAHIVGINLKVFEGITLLFICKKYSNIKYLFFSRVSQCFCNRFSGDFSRSLCLVGFSRKNSAFGPSPTGLGP